MSEDRGTSGKATNAAEKPTREERLAAKLRENLRRRKAQAREVSAAASAGTHSGADGESAGLPKTLPES